MTEQHSFYTSGGTLGRSARSYVVRRADEDVLRHLLNGDFCYVLTSRQMGKSSLMVRTADALRRDGVNVAILDLTRIGQNVSPEQWYDGLLGRVGDSLDLEDELDDYWVADRVSRLGPMQRFMGALREVVLPAVKGQVVIFVDEIDSVRSLPFSSDEFFAGIRECYNSRVGDPEFNRLSFCLLGVAQPSDLISNVYITPFNIGHRIELTDFSETEAQPLLEGLRSKSTRPKGAEAILHRVLYWTGGHPYLTQKLCETVGLIEGDVAVKDVDIACGELFLSTRSREQQDNLIFVRDRVLASREHRSAILDLYSRVLNGNKVRDDDSNAIIDSLRLSGLLIVSNGCLKVRNRIYATVFNRQWIIANMPDAELRRQKAAYWRGITFALGISLPILAIIITLTVVDMAVERRAVRDSFFASTASAQEAFDAGDYNTGIQIIDLWNPSILARKGRWKRLQDWWQGRAKLENSFAMRLLRVESSGESTFLFARQGISAGGETSCNTEMAVATAMFNGRPLIAAAGSDSSVQIWYSDTHQPFSSLQLISPDGVHVEHEPVGSALPSCRDIKREAAKLPGIMSLSFSPDGSKLAISTGSWSNARSRGSVLVWDMNQLDNVVPQVDFEKTADWTQFSNDGQYLAASSEDGTAKIWKFSSSAPSSPAWIDPRGLKAPDGGSVGGSGAHVVALSPVADHLMAIGYGDGHLVIYDYLHPISQKPLYVGVAHVSGIMSLLFLDEKGKDLRLLVGSRDGDLVLVDPHELIAAYHGGESKMDEEAARQAVKFTLRPDQGVLQGLTAGYNDDHSEAWLLTSGSNGTIGLWAITPNFHLLSMFNGHTAGVHSAAFCQTTQDPRKDSGCIVSASSDQDVRLWLHPFRGQTDTHLAQRGLMFPGQMLGVAFLGNQSEKLVTAVGATTEEKDNREHSDVVATWEYTTGKEPEEYKPAASENPMLGFGVSPDGKFLISTSRNRDLLFVDLKSAPANGRSRQSLNVHVTLNPKISIRCLNAAGTDVLGLCTADQREYLVMGVADRADISGDGYGPGQGLCLWHITDHGSLASPRYSIADGNLNPCESPEASPAGLPQQVRDFRNLARKIGIFDISANGERVAASMDAGDRTYMEIWKTTDLLEAKLPLQDLSTPKGYKQADFVGGFDAQFANMSFSPDGKYLAATNINAKMFFWPVDKTAMMPDERDYPEVPLAARGQVLAFSPDGETLAIGLQDARIVLWNTEHNRVIMEIHQHHGGILGLTFSPDGKALASSGNDGLLRVMQTEQLQNRE